MVEVPRSSESRGQGTASLMVEVPRSSEYHDRGTAEQRVSWCRYRGAASVMMEVPRSSESCGQGTASLMVEVPRGSESGGRHAARSDCAGRQYTGDQAASRRRSVCSTAFQRHLSSSRVPPTPNSTCSISGGFVVQQAVQENLQQIHNKSRSGI